MLSFLNPGRAGAHAFQSVKSATLWLEALPPLDVMTRTQLAIEALTQLRDGQATIDHGVAHALMHVDRALGPDRRKLARQLVEASTLGSGLQERIWKANVDLITGFISAYETVLDTALDAERYAAWKTIVPSLTVRVLHHYTSDAKLRIGNHEAWIPARWRSLHRIYLRAAELGIERLHVSAGDGAPGAHHRTIERDYICALVMHLLGSGNLSTAQIDWATGQIRGCSSRLKLTPAPASDEDFALDLNADCGLSRGSGGRSGPSVRFLDTTPMVGCFDSAIAAERGALDADNMTGVVARERVSVLEKMRIAMSTNRAGEMRSEPREVCEVPARVRVGLAAIHHLRKEHDFADEDDPAGNVIELRSTRQAGYSRSSWPRPATAAASDTLCATLAVGDHTIWQVTDRSTSGLRIVAQGELAPGRALGALIAVRQSDIARWRLGVTRRLKRLPAGRTEIGVSLICDHFKAVRLRPKRGGANGSGMEVEGLDTAMLGPAIAALYLPPPSRHHKPVLAKSVILPVADYSAGRELILTTPRSIYTITLRNVVEQRGDWCWATLSIVAKETRAASAAAAAAPTSAPF